MDFHSRFLKILTYIGDNIDKEILIKCAISCGKCKQFHIERNVEGIQGLHVLYDAFDEETELRYWNDKSMWPPMELLPKDSRSGKIFLLEYGFPDAILDVVHIAQNLIEYPMIPDYCLCLSYPVGSQFSAHFDSRYRWGIYIVGVNLGAPCVLSMSSPGKDTKKITLPRRSIYMLSGDARYVYKHAISKINKCDSELANKSWNPEGIRRSLTLRCTKVFETMLLEKLNEKSNIYSKLLDENRLYRPKGDDEKYLTKNEIEYQKTVAAVLLDRFF
jgi:hypothetical protein